MLFFRVCFVLRTGCVWGLCMLHYGSTAHPLEWFFSVLNPISFFACPDPDSDLEFTILDRAQYIFHPGHLLTECEAFCPSFSRGEIMLPFLANCYLYIVSKFCALKALRHKFSLFSHTKFCSFVIVAAISVTRILIVLYNQYWVSEAGVKAKDQRNRPVSPKWVLTSIKAQTKMGDPQNS